MKTVNRACHEVCPKTLDTGVDKVRGCGYISCMVSDFRLYLQEELIRRSKMNPRYSLRAFSKSLGVEPSFLSKILHGKRSITEDTLLRFSMKLGLSPKEMETYQKQYVSKEKRGKWDRSEMSFRDVTYDHFQVIADWYHYAILELLTVKGFEHSTRSISKVLGISVPEANAAIERLIRLGFLQKKREKWVNLSGNNTTLGNKFTASALREQQRQILKKALLALEDVPIERRDQTAMTMAIETRLLPVAKKKITAFRRRLCKFLQKNTKKRDDVYLLSLSLFPVTTLNQKRKKILAMVAILFVSLSVAYAGQESHGVGDLKRDAMVSSVLDMAGFELPQTLVHPQSFELLSPALILPMFPLSKNGQYQGVIIPKDFLGEGRGMHSFWDTSQKSKVSHAFSQVRSLGLTPMMYNGDVYGVQPDGGNIIFGHSTTYGIHLSFDFLNPSASKNDFRIHDGISFDPTTPLHNVVVQTHAYFNMHSAYETLSHLADTATYTRLSLYDAAKARFGLKTEIPINFLKHVDVPEFPSYTSLAIQTDIRDFDSKMQKKIIQAHTARSIETQKNLKQELKKWIDAEWVVDLKDKNEFLQKICDHLSFAMHVPKELHPRCYIGGSFAPTAYIYPGGDLIVSAGLIGLLNHLDALTFVVAHELGHLIGGHAQKRVESQRWGNFLGLLLQWAGAAYTYSGGAGTLEMGSYLSNLFGASVIESLAQKPILSVVSAGLMSYNRSQEDEADQFGHQGALAAGAGQTSILQGWQQFMTHLQTYYPKDTGWLDALYASHSSNEKRLSELQSGFDRHAFLYNKYFENGLSLDVHMRYAQMSNFFYRKMQPYLEALLEQQDLGVKQSFSSTSLYDRFDLPVNVCVLHALGGVQPKKNFFQRLFGF